MPRETLHYWICSRCSLHPRMLPSTLQCSNCGSSHYERYAQVRSEQRSAIDLSPDGSISIPGRIDSPLHPKQIAAGVQRVEVESAVAGRYSLKHLEQLGLVHEATNWNSEGANLSVIPSDTLDQARSHKSVEQILAEP